MFFVMEKQVKNTKKSLLELPKFRFKNRHIIYNFEKSPDSSIDKGFVRYHFIVSDDRFREEKIERILSNFQEKSIMNYNFDEIRRFEGKHKGTDYRYLFVTLDTEYTPKFLSFEGVSENIKRDSDLRERKKGNVEDYVMRMYE